MNATLTTPMTTQVTESTKLRLTRRGRIVFGTLAVILAMTILAMGAMFSASQAQATIENVDPASFEYVVAEPGDSLWTLANRVAPNSDTRDVIFDIKRLNQLENSDLQVGQEIAIPLEYTQ